MQTSKREHWHSRLGIIFATSGSAIGLGTLWKLPYMIGQNGGGAFIALFLLFTLLLGLPLFIAELLLGKINQKSVISIFAKTKDYGDFAPILALVSIVATLLIAGWYGVVSGWGINYFVMSIADAFHNKTPQELSEIFWLFRRSGSLNIVWQVIFITCTCFILAKGLNQGIEKYSKIFFSLLFVLVILLFLFSTTLKGFSHALEYILYPKFEQLNKEAILSALGLSLFTLSLGQGIMVTYGSYLSASQNIFKTAFIVSISVVLISVLIALMIFPMIFTFGFEPQVGESLLFITLPYVTEQLPASMALACLFFILLIFAALTSYIGQLEVLVAALMDACKLDRLKSSIITGIVCFIMGIPVALMMSDYNPYPNFSTIFQGDFLEISDIIITWLLIIFSFGVCYILGYKIKKEQILLNLNKESSNLMINIWYILIRYIIPLSLIFISAVRFNLI